MVRWVTRSTILRNSGKAAYLPRKGTSRSRVAERALLAHQKCCLIASQFWFTVGVSLLATPQQAAIAGSASRVAQ